MADDLQGMDSWRNRATSEAMSRRKGPAPTSRAFRRASKTVVEPKAVEFDAEGKPTRHTKRHRLAEPLKPRARRLAAHGDELAVRWCRNKGIGP